jgi:hypothetical protein
MSGLPWIILLSSVKTTLASGELYQAYSRKLKGTLLHKLYNVFKNGAQSP